MKTLTAAEIIAAHGAELDITPWGHDETIREMLDAEPESEWLLVEELEAPNGAKCPTYATRRIGSAGPAILCISDAAGATLETEREAEEVLACLGALETILAAA